MYYYGMQARVSPTLTICFLVKICSSSSGSPRLVCGLCGLVPHVGVCPPLYRYPRIFPSQVWKPSRPCDPVRQCPLLGSEEVTFLYVLKRYVQGCPSLGGSSHRSQETKLRAQRDWSTETRPFADLGIFSFVLSRIPCHFVREHIRV